jgi:hypothetical protein
MVAINVPNVITIALITLATIAVARMVSNATGFGKGMV